MHVHEVYLRGILRGYTTCALSTIQVLDFGPVPKVVRAGGEAKSRGEADRKVSGPRCAANTRELSTGTIARFNPKFPIFSFISNFNFKIYRFF